MRRLSLALGVTLALAACGGGGGSEEVSREDYIAAADTFCKEQNAEAKTRNEKLQKTATDAHSADEFFDRAIPQLEEGLDWTRDKQQGFRDIEPPADDRATIDKLHDTIDEEIDLLERVVDAARDRDLEKFATLAEKQQTIDDRADAIAKDYGLKECGNDANLADQPPDA
jgi:hypothetical protein